MRERLKRRLAMNFALPEDGAKEERGDARERR